MVLWCLSNFRGHRRGLLLAGLAPLPRIQTRLWERQTRTKTSPTENSKSGRNVPMQGQATAPALPFRRCRRYTLGPPRRTAPSAEYLHAISINTIGTMMYLPDPSRRSPQVGSEWQKVDVERDRLDQNSTRTLGMETSLLWIVDLRPLSLAINEPASRTHLPSHAVRLSSFWVSLPNRERWTLLRELVYRIAWPRTHRHSIVSEDAALSRSSLLEPTVVVVPSMRLGSSQQTWPSI